MYTNSFMIAIYIHGLLHMALLVLFLEPHSKCNSTTIFFTYETGPAFVVERNIWDVLGFDTLWNILQSSLLIIFTLWKKYTWLGSDNKNTLLGSNIKRLVRFVNQNYWIGWEKVKKKCASKVNCKDWCRGWDPVATRDENSRFDKLLGYINLR